MALAHEGATELTEAVFCDTCKDTSEVPDRRAILAALYRRWSGGRSVEAMPVDPAGSVPAETSLCTPERAAECDQSTILTIVHSMPAELRLVLSLFYFEQLGHADIARILALPDGTVISRLAEAKTLLRCHLEMQRTQNGPLPSPRVEKTKGGPGA
jgi:DNA-directed RNA polymerase specialized sigma24 family protein